MKRLLQLERTTWNGCGVRSRLDTMTTAFLRHQHRQCGAPISVCPPFSLLEPHACREPRRLLDAPSGIAARLSARERVGGFGGLHGGRATRHFVFSRFRPLLRPLHQETIIITAGAFPGLESSRVITGSHGGELQARVPSRA